MVDRSGILPANQHETHPLNVDFRTNVEQPPTYTLNSCIHKSLYDNSSTCTDDLISTDLFLYSQFMANR